MTHRFQALSTAIPVPWFLACTQPACSFLLVLLAGCLMPGPLAAASAAEDGLIYHPDGDAIAIVNGTRWHNRPLYGHERFSYLWTGEMPGLRGEAGVFNVGFERAGVRLPLHQFSQRVMRYRPGWIAWELSDGRFPGLSLHLEATTLADANGMTARISGKGLAAGDRALWICFTPQVEKKTAYRLALETQAYTLEPQPAGKLGRVLGRFAPASPTWETIFFRDLDDPRKAVKAQPGPLSGSGVVASVPLADGQPQVMAVIADENDPSGYARLVLRRTPLDPAQVSDPIQAYEQAMARCRDFARRLVIATPDPYLNAGAPMAVAASAGIFVNPTFVHGGSHWRQQQPGWRTMGGAIAFGWPDQIQRAVAFWGNLQVKVDDGQHDQAEYSPNGCQQAGKSRFFGKGFIDYQQPPHYEFQTQFFDEAVRAWRASADPTLERTLRPMLELHLERCRACYDPDGDGIYESYNNTWPNDSIWFNGGGTPEQSGYVYYGHLAAADMARRAGDRAAAERHAAMAAKIRKAVDDLLWMPDRGHYASYVEPWGLKRQMPDAWVYAQHVPIEAGLATPEQAWKAMFSTEASMERFLLPYGGEMRQTSNFVPGQWSIRELYHGDNFGMALGYFLAGQGDAGWSLLRGTMLESMYGDGVGKSGYSNERGTFKSVNRISPGGLSHPNCAVDFADIVSAYCRALVEGLFGYRPDYPNGVVRMEPSFPAAWDRASITTPDFSLDVKDGTYRVELTRPAKIRFGIPIRARRVTGVTVDGKPIPFTIEPWAGYGMLRAEVPETHRTSLAIQTSGEAVELPMLTRQEKTGLPGTRLELQQVPGEVPRIQCTKVVVPEREEPRLLRQAPTDATWKAIDLRGVFNGDIQTIFAQRYASPRPDRVSMRIGFDGWSAWTFTHWGIRTPKVTLKASDAPELVTPQQAHFQKPGDGRNIAFTSRWDNWPATITAPVGAHGDAVWVLVSGNTTPMQGRIANAVLRFRYADGQVEDLPLVPPMNFWSLCGFGRVDYDYQRDGFSLPKEPPAQVQLGTNCRAMVYGWKLRPGVALQEVSLEMLSLDAVIGLMGISIMNPR